MMGVYIKGMKIPKKGFVEILIHDDGIVQQTGQGYRINGTVYYTPYVEGMPAIYKAVSVPPHGRLIDADALMKGEGRYIISFGKEGIDVAEINRAPTIIPAEQGE